MGALSDGWGRLVAGEPGEEGKLQMNGEMDFVVHKMAVELTKEGSVTEVPWTMCAKFVAVMWDPTAHNFNLKHLSTGFAWDARTSMSIRLLIYGRGRRVMR